MWQALVQRGQRVGKNHVARLMCADAICAKTIRLWKNSVVMPELQWCRCETNPVCLVHLIDLVCFVYLVDLVHLAIFVQPKNQTDRTDQMNKTDWRDFSASCS